jgi:hypothetical protein
LLFGTIGDWAYRENRFVAGIFDTDHRMPAELGARHQQWHRGQLHQHKRLFGAAPKRDIARLRETIAVNPGI